MYYSAIGLLAIVILSIENYEILSKRGASMDLPVWRVYRRFLIAILIYYTTDVFWGVFKSRKMANMLIIDTTVYFITLAVGLMFWTQFAVTYLNEKSYYASFLVYSGRIFLAAVFTIVIVNFFKPVLFWVDDQCVYRANSVRHVILIVQITLLLLSSIYTINAMVKRTGTLRSRYRTIAFFGFNMAVFLTVQILFPYLPLYTIAYMVGTCLLRAFVVNEDKEEYRFKIKEAAEREKYHNEELNAARVLAYRDALTGVKSKLAYVEAEKKIDQEIRDGHAPEFAVAVFDLNELKDINDNLGHEQGDQYLISACRTICNHFKHSPVFRIGGDEFVAILEKTDYQNRHKLKESFDLIMEDPDNEPVIVSMGMSDYIDGQDKTLNDVFVRADKLMYQHKNELKNNRNKHCSV